MKLQSWPWRKSYAVSSERLLGELQMRDFFHTITIISCFNERMNQMIDDYLLCWFAASAERNDDCRFYNVVSSAQRVHYSIVLLHFGQYVHCWIIRYEPSIQKRFESSKKKKKVNGLGRS